MSLDEVIRALREASAELSNVLKGVFLGMLLFGSWARGEAREDSDVDILVLLRGRSSLELRSSLYKVVAKYVKKPLTLVDLDVDEVVKEDFVLSPLLLNAIADGVIIYDEGGYLRDLLDKGRRLLEKAELIRYKTPDGKYGWMRRDGKPLTAVEL